MVVKKEKKEEKQKKKKESKFLLELTIRSLIFESRILRKLNRFAANIIRVKFQHTRNKFLTE